MIQFSHEKVLEAIVKKQQENPACIPVTIATIPQIRMTRRIVGGYGSKVKNLIKAGRNISACDAMWDVTRVIPVCAVLSKMILLRIGLPSIKNL